MTSARICLQWTLILFNTFSVILGLLAAVGGGFEFIKCLNHTANCPEKYVQLLIAAVLLISAVVGCCGAVNASIKTLCALLVLLIALISAHSWILWQHNEARQMELAGNMVHDLWMADVIKRGAMDEVQQKYQCCGRFDQTDYPNGKRTVPDSCKYPQTLLESNIYSQGCMQAVRDSYLMFYRWEYWIHVGLICFEIIGFLITSVLIWKLMAKTRRYHY